MSANKPREGEVEVEYPRDLQARLKKAQQLNEMPENVTKKHTIRRFLGQNSQSESETVGCIEGGDEPEAHDIGILTGKAGIYQVISRYTWSDTEGRALTKEIVWPIMRVGKEYELGGGQARGSKPAADAAPAPAVGGDMFEHFDKILNFMDRLSSMAVKLRGEPPAPLGSEVFEQFGKSARAAMKTLEEIHGQVSEAADARAAGAPAAAEGVDFEKMAKGASAVMHTLKDAADLFTQAQK